VFFGQLFAKLTVKVLTSGLENRGSKGQIIHTPSHRRSKSKQVG
jgi:hypothetical protein